jgi:hypothetical protein
MIFEITPTEKLKMLEVTLTEQSSQTVKKYYFFDVAANVNTFFLLDKLEPGGRYALNLLMVDMSSNYRTIGYGDYTISTPVLDEQIPLVTADTVMERTDTTAKLHLVFSEPIKNLRVRYRLTSDTFWEEQVLIPVGLAYDVDLAGLIPGQSYEYQYILMDNGGNQTVTEWEQV